MKTSIERVERLHLQGNRLPTLLHDCHHCHHRIQQGVTSRPDRARQNINVFRRVFGTQRYPLPTTSLNLGVTAAIGLDHSWQTQCKHERDWRFGGQTSQTSQTRRHTKVTLRMLVAYAHQGWPICSSMFFNVPFLAHSW